MFGGKIQNTIIFILVSVLVSTGTIGYLYYKSSQEQLLQLQENNGKLKISVEELTTTISELEKNYQSANLVMTELNSTLSETRIKNRELIDRLAKHDISMLALSKPNLVEKIINNASNEVLRCFELLSGAPLTERERNAKTEKEFNSECSYLFNFYRNNP